MTMNDNLESLIASQNLSTAASAMNLIGSVISYQDADGASQVGQVAFLDIVDGKVNLILNDEASTSVPYDAVMQVGYPISTGATGETGGETGE
jgi:flagellar hook assembly protein FlgD